MALMYTIPPCSFSRRRDHTMIPAALELSAGADSSWRWRQ